MKYRKKPITIDAFQYGMEKPPAWFVKACKDGVVTEFDPSDKKESFWCSINTIEDGLSNAYPRDWIIRGIAGEIYSCKPEIFAQTYEPVDADPAGSEIPSKETNMTNNRKSLEGFPDSSLVEKLTGIREDILRALSTAVDEFLCIKPYSDQHIRDQKEIDELRYRLAQAKETLHLYHEATVELQRIRDDDPTI